MENIIEIQGLIKTFPGFTLGPLSLVVPKGAIYGFIGANGAGKTTTIDLMMGMGQPDGGSIRIFGLDHDKGEVEIKRRTGYAGPELRFDAWGTVGRLLSFWSSYYPTWDHAYCSQLMERFALGRDEKIATLSMGNRTKLSLVTALSHRPQLLLLDEPMTGLDVMAKQELFSELLGMVGDESRTVFISSHNLDDLERITDRVAILAQGKLLIEGETMRLVERFAQVLLPASDQRLPQLIPGIYKGTRKGAANSLIVDMSSGAPQKLAEEYGPNLEYVPVTLEELFIGMAQEH
jgi:ABC-2 type transport system ATP-binding protein